jgi:hypothetical protein
MKSTLPICGGFSDLAMKAPFSLSLLAPFQESLHSLSGRRLSGKHKELEGGAPTRGNDIRVEDGRVMPGWIPVHPGSRP